MKANEIKVGGLYVAKISDKLTTVRVDAIREVARYRRNNYSGRSEYSDATVYDVTNLRTGRKTTFRSAMKFRRPVEAKPKFDYSWVRAEGYNNGHTVAEESDEHVGQGIEPSNDEWETAIPDCCSQLANDDDEQYKLVVKAWIEGCKAGFAAYHGQKGVTWPRLTSTYRLSDPRTATGSWENIPGKNWFTSVRTTAETTLKKTCGA